MRRKLDAREILADLRTGLTDIEIMDKYYLNSRSLEAIVEKLVENNLITRSELDERRPITNRSVNFEVFRCPACNMPQFTKFDECPQCGVIITKVGADIAIKKKDPALETISETVQTPSAGEKINSGTTKPHSEEIDTSQWIEYQNREVKKTNISEANSPVQSKEESRSHTKKGHIKITVQIHLDLLNELNELGGDLSETVSEALLYYFEHSGKIKK